MTATHATLAGRRAAEALMTDRAEVRRPSTRAFEAATGGYVTTPGDLVYDGPCRVKGRGTQDRAADAGGQQISIWSYVVSLPAPVEDVHLLDEVVVTRSDLDASLINKVLVVRQIDSGSFVTARRLGCELQTS